MVHCEGPGAKALCVCDDGVDCDCCCSCWVLAGVEGRSVVCGGDGC